MQAIHLRQLIAWPIAATVLFVCSGAVADDNDPAAIEQRLKALETTPERQALVKEPTSQARKALKRVLDARAAGDASHAVELAALANDWAKLAANVVKAAELEKDLAAQQAKLTDLEQKRRRTETLLEATIAQRERTREELRRQKAAKDSREPARSSATKDAEATPNKTSKLVKEPASSTQAEATVPAKPAGTSSPSDAKAAGSAKASTSAESGTKPRGKP